MLQALKKSILPSDAAVGMDGGSGGRSQASVVLQEQEETGWLEDKIGCSREGAGPSASALECLSGAPHRKAGRGACQPPPTPRTKAESC